VTGFAKTEVAVNNSPPGERACAGLHIGFCVVADAEREELQHFAGKIFVGFTFAIRVGIEPEEHSRVLDDRTKKFAEWGSGVLTNELVLLPHQNKVLHLAVARGKIIVPHQREAFAERIGREEHAEEPPGFEPVGAVRRRSRVADRAGHRFERLGALAVRV
jgi:hypothetical protein